MFRWFINLFKSKEVSYEGRDLVEETTGHLKYNWGIIIPHTASAQGAETQDGLYNEYSYGYMLMEFLKRPFENRNSGGVYGAATSLFNKSCNASLEPHKNAYNETANGYEILVLEGDRRSELEARRILKAFSEKFPLRKNRGVKFIGRGDRGHSNLKKAKKAGMEIALLSEMFFIDCKADWIEPKVMANFWSSVI